LHPNDDRVRQLGAIVIAASALWSIATAIEFAYDLFPPGSGALFYINQAMFFIAIGGWVAGIVGLILVRAAGDQRAGRLSLWLFALGWITLLVALPVGLITRDPDLFLFPVGGLLSTIGGLWAGVMVARARRWSDWRRFSVLFYALFYFVVLFSPSPSRVQSRRSSHTCSGDWPGCPSGTRS
jgi:hypothetical protein